MDQEVTERDQYDRINDLLGQVKELSGRVQESNQHNEQLIGLLRSALMYMFWIILLLIATVIYGAIGEKGFNAVSEKVQPTMKQAAIASDRNRDLARWMC